MNILSAENLVYTVKEGEKNRNILDGLSCSIPQGVLTTITGSSGSGKTTLLYALSGILNITDGDVLFENTSLYKMKQKDRDKFRLDNMSFIYQHYNLFDFLNVEQNILLNYTLRKKKVSKEINQLIDRYLELMKLGNIRKKEINSLSGGEKQRVAIIRSFISDSKCIFADEPTGNLDKQNSKIFMQCLLSLIQESNVSVVLVTHDDEIKQYGTNQILVSDGRKIN